MRFRWLAAEGVATGGTPAGPVLDMQRTRCPLAQWWKCNGRDARWPSVGLIKNFPTLVLI